MSSNVKVVDGETLNKRNARKKLINSIIRYTILILGALIMIYPIIWLIGASFKTNSEIFSSIGFIPSSIDFSAYVKGWQTSTEYTFTTYFANTFMIIIPKVIFTVIASTLTAYGFTRFDFPFKKMLMAILVGTLFLPSVVTRVPLYLLWKELGFLDTYIPLTVPALFGGEAFFVFMMVQFMRGIPRELDEAAKVDGCNSLQILYKVLVPVMIPCIVSVALFQFMWTMNDFLGPLIYISSVSKYPVAIAIKLAMDTSGGTFEWNQTIAMSLMGLVPSLVLFFLAQKTFIEGVTAGSVKG